jgi:REP-associated tyrosine transposase
MEFDRETKRRQQNFEKFVRLVPQLHFGTHLSRQLHCRHPEDMHSRYRINESDAAHFVTSTIVEWLPVFTTAACCNGLVRSFEHCRAHKGLRIHAWVILDNHFHAIVSGPELGDTVRDLKRFTSRGLLDQVRAEGREWLVNQLAYFRAAHRKSATEHQVWQEGVHPQAIVSDEMMEQKLEYLHNNPVKRGLVASPEHWRYSSAHEWLAGAAPVMKCDPWW